MKRILLTLWLVSPVVLAGAGCGDTTSASSPGGAYKPRLQLIEVEVETVRRQPLLTEIEFTGNLLPRRVTRIVAEVEGIVRDIPKLGEQIEVVVDGKHYRERLGISYGQFVRAGDVLVELDSRDSEVGLKIAEAKLAKTKADLAQLRSWERPEQVLRLTALRDEADARYRHALTNHTRTELLVQRKAASSNDTERTSLEVATAKAATDAAQALLTQAKSGPTEEELAVQQALIAQEEAEVEQRQRTLQKATIRAPYDGVITAIHVEIGDRVAPGGNPVVELMDLSFLAAEIAVPESFVGRLKLQDRAKVVAAGSTDPVPGMVVAINDMVDPQTRTFQVRVAIDNESRQFKAGQFASVQLSFGSEESQSLAIPGSAIVYVEGQPHAFVLNDDGRVASKQVTLGVSNEELSEILVGLEVGDVIVIDDPSLLSDGMKVSVREPRATNIATK